MNKLIYLGIALGAVLPAAVGWNLGGAVGAGAALGGVLAGALALAGLLGQERALARRPSLVFHAFVGTFLIKLVAVAGGALALRYVDGWGAALDPAAYLLGFAAAATWAMAVGALRHVRDVAARKELPTS